MNIVWLVVSTHLKHIRQIEHLPQVGVNIKNIWNHHQVVYSSIATVLLHISNECSSEPGAHFHVLNHHPNPQKRSLIYLMVANQWKGPNERLSMRLYNSSLFSNNILSNPKTLWRSCASKLRDLCKFEEPRFTGPPTNQTSISQKRFFREPIWDCIIVAQEKKQ